MKIYASKLTSGIEGIDIDCLYSRLTLERQIQIRKFVRKEDVYRSLLADLMLMQIIRENLPIPHQKISFEANAYGKPFLVGINLHFNISHSGAWVVGIIDNAPVGIDIEVISPMDLDVGRILFSPVEYSDLMAKIEADRLAYFFELWTLKESYIKMLGKGLSKPLDSFAIRIDGNGIIRFEAENEPEGLYFKQYGIDKDYKMSACATNKGFPEAVIERTWEYYLCIS
ncbi:MAG: 4'-phosphopantetheinyl transferase superfamily protein [Syntrophomonas sp.]|nr:4'-phosphopantetheinyl transferase superfamily protein [Syntrophomonas sp.]